MRIISLEIAENENQHKIDTGWYMLNNMHIYHQIEYICDHVSWEKIAKLLKEEFEKEIEESFID